MHIILCIVTYLHWIHYIVMHLFSSFFFSRSKKYKFCQISLHLCKCYWQSLEHLFRSLCFDSCPLCLLSYCYFWRSWCFFTSIVPFIRNTFPLKAVRIASLLLKKKFFNKYFSFFFCYSTMFCYFFYLK